MTFSESLRQEADTLFRTIYLHPFVQEIASGQLPSEPIFHYVHPATAYHPSPQSPAKGLHAGV